MATSTITQLTEPVPSITVAAPQKTKEPTPIILIAQTPRVAQFMVKKLLPEYDVIKFISEIDQAKDEIVTIMSGQPLPRDTNNLGSYNFSRLPKHIVFGKGYQYHYLDEVKTAVGDSGKETCWYWAPLAEGENPPDPYKLTDAQLGFITDKIAANVKRVLGNVVSEGKEGFGGVYQL